MHNKYMILIQEYAYKGIGLELVDNWYLKDTTYPGTIIFTSYTEALSQAERETYDIKLKNGKVVQSFKAHVILLHETPQPKRYL